MSATWSLELENAPETRRSARKSSTVNQLASNSAGKITSIGGTRDSRILDLGSGSGREHLLDPMLQ